MLTVKFEDKAELQTYKSNLAELPGTVEQIAFDLTTKLWASTLEKNLPTWDQVEQILSRLILSYKHEIVDMVLSDFAYFDEKEGELRLSKYIDEEYISTGDLVYECNKRLRDLPNRILKLLFVLQHANGILKTPQICTNKEEDTTYKGSLVSGPETRTKCRSLPKWLSNFLYKLRWHRLYAFFGSKKEKGHKGNFSITKTSSTRTNEVLTDYGRVTDYYNSSLIIDVTEENYYSDVTQILEACRHIACLQIALDHLDKVIEIGYE